MATRLFVLSATLVALLGTGCAQMPGADQLAASRLSSSTMSAKADTKADFIAEAKAKGVKLTEAQLEEIQAERNVVPNGTFAPRPAEKLTAEQNLDVHWRKHGHEFKPALTTAADYLAQANAAGSGKRGAVRFFFDTTSYQKGYQSHVVRWVPATNDFTAFRKDGSQTTYYQSKPKVGRFIEVPAW
jgi:hypothetical protein